MADKLMRAQVTIPMESNLPEDVVVNTFYFDADDWVGRTDAWVHDGIESLLTDAYNAWDGLFPAMVGPAAHVKLYDMEDPIPRVAEAEFDIALTPSTEQPLPSEVALCVSFRAEPVSGQPQARYRGRVFLGPIKDNSLEEWTSLYNRPTVAAMAQACAGAEALLAGYNTGAPADSSIRWAVYSPTLDAAGTTGSAFNDVVEGWVDNAWDTQRRRGPAATFRDIWNDSTTH